MSDTVVSVGYERKFSDGNYGSVGLSLHWTVTYEDDSELAADADLVEARCHEIASKLRTAVLSELANERADQVQWAANHELRPPENSRSSEPKRVGVAGYPQDAEDIPF